MYKEPLYDVAMEQGRIYAQDVKGHLSTYPDTGEDFGAIKLIKVKNVAVNRNLDLDMDLYYPREPVM